MSGAPVSARDARYVRDGDRTLMIQRNKRPDDTHYGKWNGLGGKFEPGESPEECMRREVREESGLEVERGDLKGILTFPDFDGKHDWYAFCFLVTRRTATCSPTRPRGASAGCRPSRSPTSRCGRATASSSPGSTARAPSARRSGTARGASSTTRSRSTPRA